MSPPAAVDVDRDVRRLRSTATAIDQAEDNLKRLYDKRLACYRRLRAQGWTLQKIADVAGLSEPAVRKALRQG